MYSNPSTVNGDIPNTKFMNIQLNAVCIIYFQMSHFFKYCIILVNIDIIKEGY